MDAQAIAGLRPRLATFLKEFDDCFGRPEPAEHLRTYVSGQLSDLPRKSVEPLALRAGTPPRTLQQFLSRARWDEERMRRRLQQHVAARHADRQAVGIIDESSYAKKGRKTPGVKRQWCGAAGKKDNCVVSVHLAYATPRGLRVLLDGALFLPEDWSADRARCRAAGIPDSVAYRPKWQIALAELDRAAGHGLSLPWLTFDEGYGRIPQFHRELQARGQRYVAEVPRDFHGWCVPPGPSSSGRPASRADDLAAHSPAFTAQPWQAFHVKDSDKGPVVWRAKAADFYPSHGGTPGARCRLVVARNVLDPAAVKYFVSAAPAPAPAAAEVPLRELLRVGFSRWAVERCFEDDKTEVGLDHFEVRTYRSLQRHLLVSALSLLFLAEVHQEQRGEKPALDGLPGADRGQRHDRFAVPGRAPAPRAPGEAGPDHRLCPATERRRRQGPPQGGPAAAAPTGHQDLLPATLSA